METSFAGPLKTQVQDRGWIAQYDPCTRSGVRLSDGPAPATQVDQIKGKGKGKKGKHQQHDRFQHNQNPLMGKEVMAKAARVKVSTTQFQVIGKPGHWEHECPLMMTPASSTSGTTNKQSSTATPSVKLAQMITRVHRFGVSEDDYFPFEQVACSVNAISCANVLEVLRLEAMDSDDGIHLADGIECFDLFAVRS